MFSLTSNRTSDDNLYADEWHSLFQNIKISQIKKNVHQHSPATIPFMYYNLQDNDKLKITMLYFNVIKTACITSTNGLIYYQAHDATTTIMSH